MLRKLGIRTRLWTLLSIVAVGGICIAAVALTLLKSSLMEEKEAQTRKLVETVYSLVEASHRDEIDGKLSRAEAQKNALDAVSKLRYDGDNYFWINDTVPNMVMHPLKPQLDGKPLADIKDPNGVYLFNEMAQQVRDHGEGSVRYAWPKPGSDAPVAKVSYVKGYKPWGWVIGSGIYVDDVMTVFWQVASTLGAITLLLITLVTAAAYVIARSILLPLCQTSNAMREIALGDGDLTREMPVTGNDELTSLNRNFNAFLSRIRGIVTSVNDSSVQLAAAAEELAAITHENATSTAKQRMQSEHVTLAVSEVSASAQAVAQNTAEAASAARQADEAANSGRQIMQRTVSAMETLTNEINGAGDVIDSLQSESDRIGSVLSVIQGIAEQTNLLALNAAIEAARAGEQGRGFAVVADEVRTLASRTQQSTEEIQRMIERLQQKAANAVSAMESGRTQTRSTLEHVAEADRSLEKIVSLVETITDMNAQIAAAAEEQTGVSSELANSVGEIAQITEHAVHSSEQTAVATESLAHLGDDLRTLLGQFKM